MYNIIRIETDEITIKRLVSKRGIKLITNTLQVTALGMYKATFHVDDNALTTLQDFGLNYFLFMNSRELEENIDEMYKIDPV